MKTRSLVLTSTSPPGETAAAVVPAKVAPARRNPRPAATPRGASSTIRQALEIAGETLWVVLLFLVIGFVVSKAPQIDAAIDQISGVPSPSASAAAADAAREAQIRDLQWRFARDESKLAPLEQGYARLQQRHADLLKAYAELQKAHVREASEVPVAEARPVAAP